MNIDILDIYGWEPLDILDISSSSQMKIKSEFTSK